MIYNILYLIQIGQHINNGFYLILYRGKLYYIIRYGYGNWYDI